MAPDDDAIGTSDAPVASSASLLAAADEAVTAATEPPAPSKRKRRVGPITKNWFIRFHRWVAVPITIVLLLECVTGAILLFGPELKYVGNGDRYHHTEVPLSQEVSPIQALHTVQEKYPDSGYTDVLRFRGVWEVNGEEADQAVWVDPGTGEINDTGKATSTFHDWLVQVHDCFFTCEGLPWYSKSVFGHHLPGFFGEEMTVGWWFLGFLGLMLTFLCLSGIYIWWPSIRKFSTGFRVRRGRGSYTRDLDLHKVVGIIAIPFLLMWGVSGMAFPYKWVTDSYYAVVPGGPQPEVAEAEPGTGPMISEAEATAAARALHPDGWMTGYFEYTPEEEEGSYAYYFTEGFDTYKDGYIGTAYVIVDSHGGGVTDYRKADGNVFERYWADWQYGAHFGTFVPWIPRAVFWLTFGLAPVLLGITGITVWLVKWRSRRNRKARKKLDAAAKDADEEALDTV